MDCYVSDNSQLVGSLLWLSLPHATTSSRVLELEKYMHLAYQGTSRAATMGEPHTVKTKCFETTFTHFHVTWDDASPHLREPSFS